MTTQFLFFVSIQFIISASSGANEIQSIGMVKNTFTAAAYSHHAFYDFYQVNRRVQSGENITENLNYLTSIVPDKHKQIHPELFEVLPGHIRQLLPHINLSLITDSDVHGGRIFNIDSEGKTSNAYDVLMLGHQEYVTQQEYSNIKKFVSNGGTLFVLTGNVFYVEVNYDPESNTVTLVEGHDWSFDGKTAQRGVNERWEDETRRWLGSNFYPIYHNEKEYHKLANNPFNFTGAGAGEEQYYDIDNPNINILLDYRSHDSKYPIATYELNYGKGKVIVIGLPTETLIADEERCDLGCQRFFSFFDDLLINHAGLF